MSIITAKSTIFTDRDGNPITRQFTEAAWATLKPITRDGRKHQRQGWVEAKEGDSLKNFYPPEMGETKTEHEKPFNEMTKADMIGYIKIKGLDIDINRPLSSIKADLKKWMEK